MSASDLVYTELFEEITTGRRQAGSRLVELEIAGILGVSRTPVRAALARLQLEGLVTNSASKGLIVAELTREEIEEVYATRAALEGFAARMAAYLALPLDIERLEIMRDRMEAHAEAGELEEFRQLNFQFHDEIRRISRNRMLQRFIGQTYAMLRRYRGSTAWHPGRAEEAVQEHRRLIEAIRNRDPEAAEKIARAHIERAQQIKVSLLDLD